jgi:Ca-activated chloride channel homolog
MNVNANIDHGGLIAVMSRAYQRLRLRLNRSAMQKSEIDDQVLLVSLPVVVTDWRGRSVRHLRAEDFVVFEDGTPRPVAGFRESGLPLTIGLIVDNSESMRYKRRAVTEIAFSFVEATDPMDEIFVVNFNDRPRLGLPRNVVFSNDVKQLEEAIQNAEPSGKTALFDAVLLALQCVKLGSREGKCLVVISDGCDDASSANLENTLTEAERNSVRIHALGMFDMGQTGSDRGFLKLATVTGGKAHIVNSSRIEPDVGQKVARELHEYYTLLYATSQGVQPGVFRRVRVVTRTSFWKTFFVHTRTGYLTRNDPQQVR